MSVNNRDLIEEVLDVRPDDADRRVKVTLEQFDKFLEADAVWGVEINLDDLYHIVSSYRDAFFEGFVVWGNSFSAGGVVIDTAFIPWQDVTKHDVLALGRFSPDEFDVETDDDGVQVLRAWWLLNEFAAEFPQFVYMRHIAPFCVVVESEDGTQLSVHETDVQARAWWRRRGV